MTVGGSGTAWFRIAHCLTSATNPRRSGHLARISFQVTSMHREFLHLAVKRGAADTKQGRGLRDIAVGAR